MAAFCKTCSIAIYGEDARDLAELADKDTFTEEVGIAALCECCGFIVVDHDGKRMSEFSPECNCEEENTPCPVQQE